MNLFVEFGPWTEHLFHVQFKHDTSPYLSFKLTYVRSTTAKERTTFFLFSQSIVWFVSLHCLHNFPVKVMATVNLHSPKDFLIAKLFVLTIRQFFDSTSLHGFKYLIKHGLSTFEKYNGKVFYSCCCFSFALIFTEFITPFSRLFWYVVQLCAIGAAGYIFFFALDGFVSKPTFTSLESVDHPIWEIPFPAVSVCSVNKISRKAAYEYAVTLSEQKEKRKTFT